MIAFALYLLKVTLCSGVLYGYYYLALRNRIFHQWNRFYLLAAVLFSLLFPLIPMPQLFASGSPAAPDSLARLLVTTRSETIVPGASKAHWNGGQILLICYLALSVLFLLHLARGLWQIRSLLRRTQVQQLGAVSFVATDHEQAPFSFFKWLFWKKDIDLESPGGQSIFRHELVHINEGHSLDKLLMQLALAFCWINPFFWIIRRELQLIHEFIADHKAVGNEGAEALAKMILQSAYGKKFNSLINPFFQKPIKRRLAMLHKTLKQPRNAYLGRVLTLPLCAALLFAFSKKNESKPVSAEESKVSETRNMSLSWPVSDTAPGKKSKEVVNEMIREVHVNTKDGVKKITIKYKDGKQETLTEKQAEERGLITPPPPPPPAVGAGTPPPPPPPPPMPEEALVVINGKVMGTLAETGQIEKLVDPNTIESINVLKNKSATDKYGQKAAKGAIEIQTNENKETKEVASVMIRMDKDNSVEVVYKDGTTETLPEAEAVKRKIIKPLTTKSPNSGEALLVIDGTIKGKMKDFPGDSFPLKPEQIESMNVLKAKNATDKYGEKGKNGAIEITSKQ